MNNGPIHLLDRCEGTVAVTQNIGMVEMKIRGKPDVSHSFSQTDAGIWSKLPLLAPRSAFEREQIPRLLSALGRSRKQQVSGSRQANAVSGGHRKSLARDSYDSSSK